MIVVSCLRWLLLVVECCSSFFVTSGFPICFCTWFPFFITGNPRHLISEDCKKVVQICEDIGFRTRWSQVNSKGGGYSNPFREPFLRPKRINFGVVKCSNTNLRIEPKCSYFSWTVAIGPWDDWDLSKGVNWSQFIENMHLEFRIKNSFRGQTGLYIVNFHARARLPFAVVLKNIIAYWFCLFLPLPEGGMVAWQVGAVTLFMPEDFSNRIFERLTLAAM